MFKKGTPKGCLQIYPVQVDISVAEAFWVFWYILKKLDLTDSISGHKIRHVNILFLWKRHKTVDALMKRQDASHAEQHVRINKLDQNNIGPPPDTFMQSNTLRVLC